MSQGLAITVLFAGFLGLMVLRVPIAFALGAACVPLVLFDPRLRARELFEFSHDFDAASGACVGSGRNASTRAPEWLTG